MFQIPAVEFVAPPATLYKFRRFPARAGAQGEALLRVESERSYFFDMVCNGHIRMARPSTFEDPFDCYVQHFRMGDTKDEQLQVLKTKLRSLMPGMPSDVRRVYAENPGKLKVLDDQLFADAPREFRKMRESEFSIYCLCAESQRPAMWAQYADGNRGVCVQLDASVPPFHLAFKVLYREEVGKIPVPIDTQDRSHRDYLVQQMFLIKNADWQYEQEFRLVGPLEYGQRQILGKFGTRVEGLDLYFPPERVLAISVGTLMDHETEKELRSELEKRDCRVPIFRAEQSKSEFKVKFRPITEASGE